MNNLQMQEKTNIIIMLICYYEKYIDLWVLS